MRGLLITLLLGAQQLQSPYPDAVAADAYWQIHNEPIIAGGLTYYPTLETRMFDGHVMMPMDVYQGVPVFADVSIQPFTLAFVPLTPTRVRTYERGPDGERWFISGRGRPDIGASGITGAVGTAGDFLDTAASVVLEAPIATNAPAGIESIPGPRRNGGVWVEFNGTRWYSDGTAESYSPERFVRVGDYHRFGVYRERGGSDRIWIATVDGGPLAPYRKY
jgi:hypothetical protein